MMRLFFFHHHLYTSCFFFIIMFSLAVLDMRVSVMDMRVSKMDMRAPLQGTSCVGTMVKALRIHVVHVLLAASGA
jgi:hypothetical protein